MKKNNFIYLSYELSDKLTGYANGEKISIVKSNSISKGNTSNNSEIFMPAHYGTHIDYPFHFDLKGNDGGKYSAEFFVYDCIQVVDISNENIHDYLIQPEHFSNFRFNKETEILLIKTGFYKKRYKDEYWNANYGFDPTTASFFKEKMPILKAIGFDLMSLSSYKKREIGRIAHKAFLIESNILIIEDMDFSELMTNEIKRLIVSPLRFKESDGSPVTIIAELYNYDKNDII